MDLGRGRPAPGPVVVPLALFGAFSRRMNFINIRGFCTPSV
jgi:hypothetical protein